MTSVKFTTSDNRSTGPGVYNYGGDNRYTSEVYQPNTNVSFNQPTTQPGYGYVQQPVGVTNVVTSAPIFQVPRTQVVTQTNVKRESNVVKGSRVDLGTDKRFANYKGNEYKYNFFSMIDEPWNRCCEVGKCGSCPGNQCIAKQLGRNLWA